METTFTQKELTKIIELYYPHLDGSFNFPNKANEAVVFKKGGLPTPKPPTLKYIGLSTEEPDVTLPTVVELEQHLLEVQTILVNDQTRRDKITTFQTRYPVQDQIIALLKAPATGDLTGVVEMYSYYNSL